MKLDRLKKLCLLRNLGISGNAPYDIGNMTGLVELDMSFTSLYDNTPSEFGLIKDLCYIVMDKTHIHGPIPAYTDNMQQIKYISIESLLPTTQFLWFPRYFPSGSRIYIYINFDVEFFDQIPVILPIIFLMQYTPHVTPWYIQSSAYILLLTWDYYIKLINKN